MKFFLLVYLFTMLASVAFAQQKAGDFTAAVPRDIDAMLRAQMIVQNYRDRLVLKQSMWSSAEDAENKIRAARAFKLGQEYFAKEDFKKARTAFENACKLDPKNDIYFYSYAIDLYKINFFRRSLAILNMLESTSVNQTELTFYEGLDHMNLREDDLAYSKFIIVRDEKDVQLSSLAAMYAGVLAKKKFDYGDARTNFEFVLDNSQDPKLDQKAETAIEITNQEERFNEQAKKKWGYSFYTGAISDGNVLNTAKANQVTSAAAYRLLYGGSIAYKAHFTQKSSLLPQLSFSDIYSVNTKLKSDTVIQSADPLQLEASLPYRRQINLFSKPASWYVSPAYQNLFMSYDEGSRKKIFDSIYLVTSLSLSHFENWISEYRLEYSKDNSHITGVTDDNKQDSQRYTLALSQTRLLDGSGKTSVSGDFLYSENNANGSNMRYRKYILSLGGNRPLFTSWLGYGRLDYVSTDYYQSVLGRNDKGIVITTGGYRSVSPHSSVNLNIQYYTNNSTVGNYDYNKFVFTAMYIYRGGFL
jgi:tetratricopeptide (TPR) repeat protein